MTVMTGAGGMSAASMPDVCKVPSPAGPVPTPLVNMCQFTMVNPGTCSTKVMAQNMPMATMNSEVTLSSGDEAGSAGGVVSGVFINTCKVLMGSTKVMAQNKGLALMGGMMGHNGSSPNAVGSIAAPSVPTVSAMP